MTGPGLVGRSASGSGLSGNLAAATVRALLGLPSFPAGDASSAGCALVSNGVSGETDWSASPAALMPGSTPAAGVLTVFGGANVLSSGGTVTHTGTVRTQTDSSALDLRGANGVQFATVGKYGGSFVRVAASSAGYPVVIAGNLHGVRVGDGTYTIDIKPVGSNSVVGFYAGQGTLPASGALATLMAGALSLSQGVGFYGVAAPSRPQVSESTGTLADLLTALALSGIIEKVA